MNLGISPVGTVKKSSPVKKGAALGAVAGGGSALYVIKKGGFNEMAKEVLKDVPTDKVKEAAKALNIGKYGAVAIYAGLGALVGMGIGAIVKAIKGKKPAQ